MKRLLIIALAFTAGSLLCTSITMAEPTAWLPTAAEHSDFDKIRKWLNKACKYTKDYAKSRIRACSPITAAFPEGLNVPVPGNRDLYLWDTTFYGYCYHPDNEPGVKFAPEEPIQATEDGVGGFAYGYITKHEGDPISWEKWGKYVSQDYWGIRERLRRAGYSGNWWESVSTRYQGSDGRALCMKDSPNSSSSIYNAMRIIDSKIDAVDCDYLLSFAFFKQKYFYTDREFAVIVQPCVKKEAGYAWEEPHGPHYTFKRKESDTSEFGRVLYVDGSFQNMTYKSVGHKFKLNGGSEAIVITSGPDTKTVIKLKKKCT